MISKKIGEIPMLNSSKFRFDLGLPDNADQTCTDTDFCKAVNDAISSLHPFIGPEKTVCIIVDDYTRSTPTSKILTFLLPGLEEAGIKKDKIFFMYASGSHRLMTEQEKRARLSDRFFESYRSMDHHFFDKNHLVKMGKFDDGAPIYINKHVIEADMRIAIGTLVPHMPAGFSGGAKMLLPGVAGEDTVHHMHVVGALDPKQAIGVTDTLPRKLMEELAKTADPFTILNVILNAEDLPVGIVGGHYVEAHRRGVEIARKTYFVQIPERVDLVVSDTRNHDVDMTQANKGLFSAALAVKEGGEILLVANCRDGVSPVHGKEMLGFGLLTNTEMEKALDDGTVKDPMSAIEVIHNNVVRKKSKLYLHSPNITKEEAEKMNFEYVEDLQEFVESRLNTGKTVGRLRASTFVVPFLKK
ncbi:nickel-dependent lactate racemase [Mariniphaga sediminis]|uniref:Nickel-dependent lactate racemase n=1 Tax=Mariniphaga sediminis TaxID=1628158 RepID=A0A399CXS3_9BACT|nr:nickel-dependent lactate racemase [Mariniphaga sediminis]RIH64474.1 nickel-dependent lactate racemase [Mariniphaga sediminis]